MRNISQNEEEWPGSRTPGRYLLWLARRVSTPITLGVIYGVATMVMRSFMPIVIGVIIDRGVLRHNQRELLIWGGVLFGLVVTQAITTTLQERCDFATNISSSYRVMEMVNQNTAGLGATLQQSVSAGDVMNIGIGDISPIGAALASTSRGIGAAVAIVVVAFVMLSMAWQLGLTVLIGVPLIVWLLTMTLGPVRGRQRQLREQQGELTGFATDLVEGLRALNGVGGERQYGAFYDVESQKTRDMAVSAAGLQARASATRTILNGLLSATVIWLGAHLVLSRELQVGQLIAFYGYAIFLTTPLRWITDSVGLLSQGKVSAERVVQFLSLKRRMPYVPANPPAAARPALADPSAGLVVPYGTLTAVVCASSADMLTLGDRLAGYVESDVTLAGVPLASLSLASVRERVLLVRNDDYLFAGTLRAELDPLLTGDDPQILRTAAVASAIDIIEALPDGLDGAVQAGGRNFSGGERQRLRLLRALLADPDVLILIEPTNSLDALTEATVAQQVRASRAGKTTMVFTTSPAWLGQADQVCFTDESGVIAEGTHDRLLQYEDYASLVTRKAKLE